MKSLFYLILSSSLGFISNSWATDPNPILMTEDQLQIEQAWIRAVPPTMDLTAAYMHIKNLSDQELILQGGHSPAFEKVEIHKSVIENDLARMIPIDTLSIPAHQNVQLEPGGIHLMLIGKKQTLEEGKLVSLQLQFNQGQYTLELPVKRKEKEAMPHHSH